MIEEINSDIGILKITSSNANQKHKFSCTFQELTDFWNEEHQIKEVKCKLQELAKALLYQNFEYRPDFHTSGFDQIIVQNISNKIYAKFFLNIVMKISSLNSKNYIQDLLNLDLFSNLFDCFFNIETDDDDKVPYQQTVLYIIRNILIIFPDTLPTICEFITQNITFISELFGANESIRKPIYLLFDTMLVKNTQCDVSFLYEPILTIFNEYTSEDTKMCLSLVYCALSSNGFIDYAQESPLYQTLIEMVKNVSCEELLKLLVAIFYKLIKVNFEVVEDLVPRFIDLIGSSFEKVSFGATLIIKKILKDEPDWVQQEKHHYLADNLMKKISDSSFERKRMYLKCLLRLLRIVSRNFLKELTNKKLVGMLMEFLDFGYDADLTDTILDLLKSLVNMEFEECGTLNLMDEIMENGGEDTLKQFLDCEDEEAAELATKLLNLAQ